MTKKRAHLSCIVCDAPFSLVRPPGSSRRSVGCRSAQPGAAAHERGFVRTRILRLTALAALKSLWQRKRIPQGAAIVLGRVDDGPGPSRARFGRRPHRTNSVTGEGLLVCHRRSKRAVGVSVDPDSTRQRVAHGNV